MSATREGTGEEGRRGPCIVTNHWGWWPRGIWRWFRYGWAKPFVTWGIEIHGSSPPRFERRVKVGPFCFSWGEYPPGETHV